MHDYGNLYQILVGPNTILNITHVKYSYYNKNNNNLTSKSH